MGGFFISNVDYKIEGNLKGNLMGNLIIFKLQLTSSKVTYLWLALNISSSSLVSGESIWCGLYCIGVFYYGL